MAKADKVQEVNRQSGEVKKRRRFDDRDWKYLAEYVIQEHERRAKKREDRERQWKEIDRQVAMEPYVSMKYLPDGRPDPRRSWMAETELPLQAQALEVLTADSRRMMFPDGPWFRARAQVTDSYLRKVEGEGGIKVLGDEKYVWSTVNQDNADKLVEGYLNHCFRQYDHPARFDVINSEAFKYGIGVGRGRLLRKNIFIHEARGDYSENKLIPTIVPCSIKNLYLEESRPSLHSATVLGEAHIAVDNLKYENLAIAANKGDNDPEDEDGGWMPEQLSKVLPDKNGYVKILEMEGDIVVPRKTVRSIVIPGAIITVAMGGGEKGNTSTRAVVRFRFRKYPFSSYLLFPYLHESADDTYPTGPLMKGRTVQQTATDAVNRFLDSGALKNSPPVGYDPTNRAFTQTGGPEIYPNAQWETMDPVKVYTEIGGDPSALAQAALQFINLYAELTGVLPARVGAQTRSHTTATAKDVELQRGAVRTVDYVNAIGAGPVTRWLDMAYRMGRDALGSREELPVYIAPYGGYVLLDKTMLPDSEFEWFGSGGPQEKKQKAQDKISAAKMALEMDAMAVQTGRAPTVNVPELIKEILREGGWEHLDQITNVQPQFGPQGAPAGPEAAPGIPGSAQGNPGALVAALQNIPGGGA